MLKWKEVKLGDILTESEIVSNNPDPDKRITVRLNCKGVEKRPYIEEIKGATKYFIRNSGQFIYGKQNLFKGAFGIIPKELDGFESSSDIPTFDISKECIAEWIVYFLRKGEFYKTLEPIAKGSGSRRIHPEDLFKIKIPLPTTSIQRAIITKINKIEKHYEMLKSELENQEQLVSNLRQVILQEAVQGKLVPQDSADEPATELLKRIKAEKDKLIRGKKIKREKLLQPISKDEIPYELPEGWVWVRFPEIGELARGKSKNRPRNDPMLFVNGNYPFVQTGDVARSNGKITTYSQMYNDLGLKQSRMWKKGTLCITIAANIAETGILQFDACFPDSVVGFIPSPLIGSPEYFEYFLRVAKNQLVEYAPSTAQKNINLGILEEILIPLPPLNELKRIVAKVDELMKLCDELEEQIRQSKEESERLMQAVLREAFEGKDVEESNAEVSVA